MMKRIISAVFAILLLAAPLMMTSCEKEQSTGDATTLYVYNWG